MIKNCIEGQIASLSESGDLVTDIAIERCSEIPGLSQAKIKIGPHETIGVHTPDHGEPEGTMIATQGESGNIEIGITGMNMSEMLGIPVGQKVQISW